MARVTSLPADASWIDSPYSLHTRGDMVATAWAFQWYFAHLNDEGPVVPVFNVYVTGILHLSPQRMTRRWQLQLNNVAGTMDTARHNMEAEVDFNHKAFFDDYTACPPNKWAEETLLAKFFGAL